jgi:hypothetical protein
MPGPSGIAQALLLQAAKPGPSESAGQIPPFFRLQVRDQRRRQPPENALAALDRKAVQILPAQLGEKFDMV